MDDQIPTRKLRHIYRTEYNAWQTAKQRCVNPKNPAYPNYGGRGISMSPKWISNFPRFLSDMGPKPSKHLMLDRKDNDGDYGPENTRWTTRAMQNRNHRRNRWVSFCGERMVVEDFAEKIGSPSCYVIFWMRRGLGVDEIAYKRYEFNRKPKVMDGYRICCKCHEIKLLDHFPKDKGKKHGRSHICLECNRIKNRRYYKEKSCKLGA